MGWVHIEKTVHDCPTPKVHVAKKQGYTLGSIWCCDDCGQKWKLYFSRYERHGESVFIDASIKADATEPVSETDPKLSDCDHRGPDGSYYGWTQPKNDEMDFCTHLVAHADNGLLVPDYLIDQIHWAGNEYARFDFCPRCGEKIEWADEPCSI